MSIVKGCQASLTKLYDPILKLHKLCRRPARLREGGVYLCDRCDSLIQHPEKPAIVPRFSKKLDPQHRKVTDWDFLHRVRG